jgi:thiamine transport system ATP-binding protein
MLAVDGVTVVLDGRRIIEDVHLEVGESEIVGILGPSGSGKSTLLRAIAGLLPLSAGRITWKGEDQEGVPVHLRGFGLMFQGYALFPHLDVGGNVGFGVPKEGRESAVVEALHMVDLDGFEDRPIDGLSGGERQRVALARTLAPRPKLVMLDEPLGALDRSLRDRLVVETREVLEGQAVTALIVTHDRDEAASMTDRLALMRDGRIIQIGSLGELTRDPIDEWVADFLK